MTTLVSPSGYNKAANPSLDRISMSSTNNRSGDTGNKINESKTEIPITSQVNNHNHIGVREHLPKKKLTLTKNIQKVWNNSFAHQRAALLRSIGINDDITITKLVDFKYVELDVEIRFKLEVVQN